MNKKQLIGQAIEALAVEFPNSIVADLLVHFPAEVAFKLIEIYSGRILRIPRVESIWRSYRNKVIYDALYLENTLAVRRQLSEFFGISPNHVQAIYTYRKKQKMKDIRKKTVIKSAEIIYKGQMKNFLEEMKEFPSKK